MGDPLVAAAEATGVIGGRISRDLAAAAAVRRVTVHRAQALADFVAHRESWRHLR